jgi:hypothetical protein
MKIQEIRVMYGRTHQTKRFSSLKSEVAFTVQLDEEEDPMSATEMLREVARNHVLHELARVEVSLREQATLIQADNYQYRNMQERAGINPEWDKWNLEYNVRYHDHGMTDKEIRQSIGPRPEQYLQGDMNNE